MQYFHAHTSQACPQFTMNFTGYNIKHLVLPHEMDKNTRPIDEILRGSKASREHIRGEKPLKSQMNDKEKNSTKKYLLTPSDATSQRCCSGTVFHVAANLTIAAASIRPNP